MENKQGVIFPNPKTDYHGHPNYRKVLISLLILLAVSLIVGYIFSPMLAVILIFATAIWKVSLVMRNFMHLKFEPILIWIAVAAVIFVLFTFFFLVFVDVTPIYREVVPR